MKKLFVKTIIVWVLCIIPIISIAGALVFFVLFFLVVKKRKYKEAILFTFLSPVFIVPLFFFFKGTNDYFSGTAVLISGGDPSIMGGNLNPEYRVRHDFTTGIAFVGIRFFLDKTNNIAVKALTKKFGYQKGAYSGIYPDGKASIELLSDSNEFIDVEVNNEKIKLKFHENEIILKRDQQNSFISASIPNVEKKFRSPYKFLDDECLLFNIGQGRIYLLDVKRKEFIAFIIESFLNTR